MEYLYPDYYHHFKCIAHECEDTCCTGWQIAIDKKSLKKYKNTTGVFGNRLYNSINWEEQIFEQCEKRCAFLNENNLCDLYMELGADALCRTCKTYPRHVEEYENIREITLSLSCPEACRIILSQKKPVSFISIEHKTAYEEYENFDFFFFTQLEACRDFLTNLIQNRTLSLKLRLSIAIVFAYDVQRRIQLQQLYDIDSVLLRYQNETMVSDLKRKFAFYTKKADEFEIWFSKIISVLETLEPLHTQWFTTLNRSLQILRSVQDENQQKKQQFRTDFPNLEIELEQIFVNLLYTYFCGAVYDYDVLSKMKFIVISVMIIYQLDFARWLGNQESFTMADQVDLTHRYSREIEHSDVNLDRFEKLLKKNPIFHYQTILGMILIS